MRSSEEPATSAESAATTAAEPSDGPTTTESSAARPAALEILVVDPRSLDATHPHMLHGSYGDALFGIRNTCLDEKLNDRGPTLLVEPD